MTKTVSALYDTYGEAAAAVAGLQSAGVPRDDISLVANNSDNLLTRDRDGDGTSDVAEDAEQGAGIGAAVGGVGGLLAGLGMLAIPGLGPVVAAGWLASTAAGAVAGAVIGGAASGLVGALTAAGVPEEHANVYAEGVRRGGTLVTAKVDDELAYAAETVLRHHKSVDIGSRAEAYRQGGWKTFDPDAPAYTADQVAAERSLYGSR